MANVNGLSRPIQTSDTNPIRVDFLWESRLSVPGRLGMTIAPGKKDLNGWTGAHDRDLREDLDRLFAVYRPTTIVSLMEDFEYTAFKIPTLLEEIRCRGVDVLHYPIRDVSVPKEMDMFADLIDGVYARLKKSERVVVHCKGGLGRTGIVVAAVLIRDGYGHKDAIALTRECRSGTIQTGEQAAFVHEYAVWQEQHRPL